MTMSAWIKKYEAKAEPYHKARGYTLRFDADNGFFLWRVFGDVLDISHTSTRDIRWMMRTAEVIAREHGCKMLRTRTLHNPAAFVRLTGAFLDLNLSYVYPNGIFYWTVDKEVTNYV